MSGNIPCFNILLKIIFCLWLLVRLIVFLYRVIIITLNFNGIGIPKNLFRLKFSIITVLFSNIFLIVTCDKKSKTKR